jgi:excinuclease UvrABC nuclease subunit
MKCQLYRHFAADGSLLYIGVSNLEKRRRLQHKSEGKWFKEIARVEVVDFPSREEARRAEIESIERERPKYNIESRRVISEKDEARRARAFRARLKASGLSRYDIYLHPSEWPLVKRYIERLAKRRTPK